MKILGIETSCDDTAMAIVEVSAESNSARYDVLSNVISGQVEIHAKYGGVVPTLAAREHAKNFTPVLQRTLEEANKARLLRSDLMGTPRSDLADPDPNSRRWR